MSEPARGRAEDAEGEPDQSASASNTASALEAAPLWQFDQARVAAAAAEVLQAIGEDPTRPGLQRTPDRVARAWAERLAGYGEDPASHLRTTFQVESDELVLVRDIEFQSVCEHHMLPFTGHAHVAYLPNGGRVTGLSKLGRCVDGFARRLQVQERLTQQVVDAVEAELGARGVAAILSAEHTCMTLRGVRKPGARTVTAAFRGELDNPAARAELLSLLQA